MENARLDFVPIAADSAPSIAVLSLNRPAVSNALNAGMIEECLAHFTTVEKRSQCRALVLRGEGKHFSAGADIEWMRESTKLGYAGNLKEVERMSDLFSRLIRLPLPTLAVVQGAAFGGALGLIAACDWAIATEEAKFCLSEVRVGVLPATILPQLCRKVSAGALRRWMLTGRVIEPAEALRAGLVQRVVAAPELEAAVRDELDPILRGEPDAQRTVKFLHQDLMEGPADLWEKHRRLMFETIARARTSPAGQKGLNAFLQKQEPAWVCHLPDDWTYRLK
jgi:methylglutaconyl-CoA hydratase